MKQRYTGEARHAILTAIASTQRPKMVVVVDPDIDVRNPDQVEWAIAFRSQPVRDVIIVDGLPGGTLDPSIDGSIPLNRRVGSAMGIDATFPFGADEQKADDVPAGEACGPAVAEHGHEFFKAADVPGWQEYDFPELQKSYQEHALQREFAFRFFRKWPPDMGPALALPAPLQGF
jgi:2,5-furandicarboxylate decarboxylase 1